MSGTIERRGTPILSKADDAMLLDAVTARRVEAVAEAYDRHAATLYRLALVLAADRARATRAVAGAYLALWAHPDGLDLEEHSLCAALAGDVYGRCTEEPITRDLPDHVLALALLGDHTHDQAARRVGLNRLLSPAP